MIVAGAERWRGPVAGRTVTRILRTILHQVLPCHLLHLRLASTLTFIFLLRPIIPLRATKTIAEWGMIRSPNLDSLHIRSLPSDIPTINPTPTSTDDPSAFLPLNLLLARC